MSVLKLPLTNHRLHCSNHKELTRDVLRNIAIVILAGPQAPFTENECASLKAYIEGGGNVMVLLGEGGEPEHNTNINFLLEDFGMSVNADSCVRTQYYKYFHPKECMIGGGIVCEPMWRHLLDQPAASRVAFEFGDPKDQLHFVYPFGATLTVAPPSSVLATTGAVVYPFQRPVVGYCRNARDGRLLAIGSGHMFHDRYIAEETNAHMLAFFMRLLSDAQLSFSTYDFSEADVQSDSGTLLVPDTIHLAEQPKMCLLESMDCDIPADFKKMFEMRLHSINNDLVPQMIGLHGELGVQYEPLKIIKPQFEIPLPALQLAVFPPVFSDVPPPALELFDLDESFSSERAQVTQLANKCLVSAEEAQRGRGSGGGDRLNVKELEYFVIECGRIVNGNGGENGLQQSQRQQQSAKEILYDVCVKIAKYKKLDRD